MKQPKLDLFGNPIPKPVKCKHCGKIKGDHKGGTFNCPQGAKTRIGYLGYSNTVFTPKEPHV